MDTNAPIQARPLTGSFSSSCENARIAMGIPDEIIPAREALIFCSPRYVNVEKAKTPRKPSKANGFQHRISGMRCLRSKRMMMNSTLEMAQRTVFNKTGGSAVPRNRPQM
ncbi:hypothetical protein GCM10025857_13450 [Alicyclobacillus contaminans]|nr:hypothetical protein GCM10025857_13450 [Alicyclobacillus contaminans]